MSPNLEDVERGKRQKAIDLALFAGAASSVGEVRMNESPDRPALMFVGDPHGDFETVVQQVLEHQPGALILLGDLQPLRPLEVVLAQILSSTEIWFIHGNHDTSSDEDYDNVFLSQLSDRNLHGRVAEVAGIRIGGLGGVFRQKVWDPGQALEMANFHDPEQMLWSMKKGHASSQDLWRGGIQRKHRSSIFPADVQRLQAQRAEILITHEAPGDHPHGFPVLDNLAVQMGVKVLVHGHHHEDINYRQAGLLSPGRPYEIFGVNKGSCLMFPMADRKP